MIGYTSPLYAESMAEFGTRRQLPACGGWVLERPIPRFPYRDAMGCYPLFTCQDWSQLHVDLEEMRDDLITLSLVTDPFGDYDQDYLQRCFKDVVIRFKEHFVVDLSRPMKENVSEHHRYYSRKALRTVRVEKCDEPAQYAKEWGTLYDTLIDRHNIAGLRAFSKEALGKQLYVPGMEMFRAVYDDETAGILLCVVQREICYAHLTSFTENGLRLGASYALLWSAIEHYSERLCWLDIGGAAGVVKNTKDGLDFFKRGWTTQTRPVYFCGRIFDRKKYDEIVLASGISSTDYFPAYRKGEFA
jgi:hypothetical protein